MILFLILGFWVMLGGIGYGIYFSKRVLKLYTNIELTKVKNIGIILLVILVSIPAVNIFSLYAIIYFHFLVISVILELLYLFLKRYRLYTWVFTTGLLSLVVMGCILGYGYYNMRNVVLTNYSLETNKIDTLKVLQITDLHMSNSVNIAKLEECVKEMNAQKPDIVFLTGDIFDEKTPREDMETASKILGKLDNKLGIYYVYGNHDKSTYTSKPKFTGIDVKNNLEENGIVVLEDTVATIDNITIVGRSDASAYRQTNTTRRSTKELLKNVNPDNYIIVLDHQPIELEANAVAGVDLQLSGHTHGGQLFPMGPIEAMMNGNLVYGTRTMDDFVAITSSGIAGWGNPIKTGAPSEYVIIDINK